MKNHMRLHCYETSDAAFSRMMERAEHASEDEAAFLLDPHKFDTFTAHMEFVDCYDGVLLDNYLYETVSGGYAAIYECYETPNSSVYLVVMGSRLAMHVDDEFYEHMEEYERGIDGDKTADPYF